MPPKAAKKKKKTKEELEEERRLAEEAARLAEEERLRLEEEERQRLAELERQRQALLTQLLSAEQRRVADEQLDLEPFTGQLHLERAKAQEQRSKDWEWERFLACTSVPHPKDRVALSDRLRLLAAGSDTQLGEALTICQDCYTMADEAVQAWWQAYLNADGDGCVTHAKDMAALHQAVGLRIDRVTAHVLQHSDEHANDKGEIQLGVVQGPFKWALWVNTSKNPRLKAVEMPALRLVAEVPKQIALANIAMRIHMRQKDEFFAPCANEFMAVGGVLYVDLLALPPPAKRAAAWVLRQVTPLSTNVLRVPYPIPPAGADPATYRSDEEPPPLGFALPFPTDLVLLDGAAAKVGWWDAEAQGWSRQGVTDVHLDCGSGSLSFRTTHLGPLAVIQSRTALLPYATWSVRPSGGRGGHTAVITLSSSACADPICIEVGPGWAQLRPIPSLPVVEPLTGARLPPELLLTRLSDRGLHLLPQDRDARWTGTTPKAPEVEAAMCQDVALLGGAFLICRSKWNQGAAGADECLVRLNEVVDWEGGGRTEAHHVARIFSKEKEEGDRRVLVALRRGTRGVAFSDALDRRPQYARPPGHESVESVQACMNTVWGEVHASLVSLLWLGTPGEPSLATLPKQPSHAATATPQQEDSLGGLGSSTTDPLLSLAGEESEPHGPAGTKALAGTAVVQPPKPRLGPEGMDPALAARLSCTPAGLELVRGTDAVFTETLGRTLLLLRVFSFS